MIGEKIKNTLKCILKTSIILTLALHLNPFQASADDEPLVDFVGLYADAETYTNTNSSSQWFGTYISGTGYKGQGILI